MTINYRFGDVDAHGAAIRGPGPSAGRRAEADAAAGPSTATRAGTRSKQPGAIRPTLTASSAVAGRNTPADQDGQYLEPTYMRRAHRQRASMPSQ